MIVSVLQKHTRGSVFWFFFRNTGSQLCFWFCFVLFFVCVVVDLGHSRGNSPPQSAMSDQSDDPYDDKPSKVREHCALAGFCVDYMTVWLHTGWFLCFDRSLLFVCDLLLVTSFYCVWQYDCVVAGFGVLTVPFSLSLTCFCSHLLLFDGMTVWWLVSVFWLFPSLCLWPAANHIFYCAWLYDCMTFHWLVSVLWPILSLCLWRAANHIFLLCLTVWL